MQTDTFGKTTQFRRGAVAVSLNLQEREFAVIYQRLANLEQSVRHKILRKAIRRWGEVNARRLRDLTPRSKGGTVRTRRGGMKEPGGNLKRAATYVIRSRKKTQLWAGIGYEFLKAPGVWVPAGWRAHFTENGSFIKSAKKRGRAHHMLAKLAPVARGDAFRQVEASVNESLAALPGGTA
jgi:hypothetical protein